MTPSAARRWAVGTALSVLSVLFLLSAPPSATSTTSYGERVSASAPPAAVAAARAVTERALHSADSPVLPWTDCPPGTQAAPEAALVEDVEQTRDSRPGRAAGGSYGRAPPASC